MNYRYDFETLPDHSRILSSKFCHMRAVCPDAPDGTIPLSVADMEFVTAPEIARGLSDFVLNNSLGYGVPTTEYYDTVADWMNTHHGFTPEREWFVPMPGVVPALAKMVPAFTRPGDAVIINSPVYYPFRTVIEASGRHVADCPLIEHEGVYSFDFARLERLVRRDDVTLFIICSPHNPVGKIFTEEEIRRIAALCQKNGVYVIADEIHHDLIMPGQRHFSFGALEPELLINCAVCTAPSKTFNLAGLQASNIFVPHPERRRLLSDSFGYPELSSVAYRGCELAYSLGGDWLNECIHYIDANMRYLSSRFARSLPELHFSPLEATYLGWLDCRALGLPPDDLEEFMNRRASLFFDEGYIFGHGGAGFERINLACPRRVLEAAADRLEAAVAGL